MSDENKNTAKTTEPIWDSRNSDEPNVKPCHLAAVVEDIFSAICGRKGFDLRSLEDEFQDEIRAELAAIIAKHCGIIFPPFWCKACGNGYNFGPPDPCDNCGGELVANSITPERDDCMKVLISSERHDALLAFEKAAAPRNDSGVPESFIQAMREVETGQTVPFELEDFELPRNDSGATPRCDEQEFGEGAGEMRVDASFARQLERELNEARAENERLMLRSKMTEHILDGDEGWQEAVMRDGDMCPTIQSAIAIQDRLAAAQKEIATLRKTVWQCGCGTINGVNLSECSVCLRHHSETAIAQKATT